MSIRKVRVRRSSVGRVSRGASKLFSVLRNAERHAMLDSMDQRLTALERAFQLAESGRVASVTEIVSALKHEGYGTDQVQGRQLLAQLRKLIGASRAPRP